MVKNLILDIDEVIKKLASRPSGIYTINKRLYKETFILAAIIELYKEEVVYKYMDSLTERATFEMDIVVPNRMLAIKFIHSDDDINSREFQYSRLIAEKIGSRMIYIKFNGNTSTPYIASDGVAINADSKFGEEKLNMYLFELAKAIWVLLGYQKYLEILDCERLSLFAKNLSIVRKLGS